ncbi:MAG TPA: hypothetical protein VIJ94_00445, partial [Caulobacteraceae bacterium]
LASQAGALSLALRRTGAVELQPVRAVGQGDLGPVGSAEPSATPVRHARRAAAAPTPVGVGVLVVTGDTSAHVDVPSEHFKAGV